MKRIIPIALSLAAVVLTACGSRQKASDYPSTPKEVACKFLEYYNTGDERAAEYVLFDGENLPYLAMTAETARTEHFPKELAKMRGQAPVQVEYVSERITTDEDCGNPDVTVAYVECKVNGASEYLKLCPVDGLWKVDITVKWADDWFDGQIF